MRAEIAATLSFVGELTLSFGRLAIGRARFRRTDLTDLLREAGFDALPVVALISFPVGSILAFVGAVQLQSFGAQIFVADLVGIAMVREIGAMMAAIIMAGRTGASFAAREFRGKAPAADDAPDTLAGAISAATREALLELAAWVASQARQPAG